MVKPYTTRVIEQDNRGTKYRPYCIKCSVFPAEKEALFKVNGVVIVEKYCSSCIETASYHPLR